MVVANVSFGILAFTPLGWIFISIVIAIEAIVLSKVLHNTLVDVKVGLLSLASNGISAVAGVGLSLLHNGGWWLVVWIPWVSSNEVSPQAMPRFRVYLLVAFVLTLAIESGFNLLILRKHPVKTVLKGTLLANALTAVGLAAVLYSFGGLWR